MAVASSLLTFPEASFTPQDFSIMLDRVSTVKTGIMYGCTVTSTGEDTVAITEGWVAVRGRLVKVEEGTLAFTLPSSGSATYLVLLTVNLSNTAAPTSVDIATEVPGDEDANFNYDNGKAYCILATITTNPITITQITNFGPGTEVNYTLAASSWNTSDKTYTINNQMISATSDQEFLPALDISAAQLKALQKANIQDAGQSAGSATIKAYGVVPTIDIPIRIKYKGGL